MIAVVIYFQELVLMCGLFIYTAVQSVLSLSVKVAADPSGRQTKLPKAVDYITFFRFSHKDIHVLFPVKT